MSFYSGDNIIDTRDIIKKIDDLEEQGSDLQSDVETLEEQVDSLTDEIESLQSRADDDDISDEERDDLLIQIERLTAELEDVTSELVSARASYEEWNINESDELEALKEIIDEIGSEARHGVTLISEGYFTEYTEEFAKDVGAVGDNSSWIVIDWVSTAENLQQDYSQVDIDGETYYYLAS